MDTFGNILVDPVTLFDDMLVLGLGLPAAAPKGKSYGVLYLLSPTDTALAPHASKPGEIIDGFQEI